MKTPTETAIAKVAKEHATNAEKALAFIREEGTIENIEDYRAAPKVIADYKAQRDALDAQRKEWTDPLNAVVKSITAAFKPATEFLDEAEAILKERIATFRGEQEDERVRILGQVEKADPANREALMKSADELEVPKLKGVSFRESWTGEVIDREALVGYLMDEQLYELLMPDVKALQAFTKSKKKDPNMPGWRAFKKTVVAISKALAK